MRNSLVSTLSNSPISSAAVLLVLALCAAPLVAQDAPQPGPPADAPAETSTTTTTSATTAASPGVRIVRLSQVTGEVQLDRKTGNGFESAFANLPIVQGSMLRTGE